MFSYTSAIRNLALKRPAYQSSSFGYSDYYGIEPVAGLAVDGDISSHFDKRSCSSTKEDDRPWWTADLLREYLVTEVVITNRGDCCGSFFLVSNKEGLVSSTIVLVHEMVILFHFSWETDKLHNIRRWLFWSKQHGFIRPFDLHPMRPCAWASGTRWDQGHSVQPACPRKIHHRVSKREEYSDNMWISGSWNFCRWVLFEYNIRTWVFFSRRRPIHVINRSQRH